MKVIHKITVIGIWIFLSALQLAAVKLPGLKISPNSHYLVQDKGKGKPFLWIGDTGWRLCSRNREEIEIYFQTRSEQQFNVIQGPVLIEIRKNEMLANAEGALPLTDISDPTSLNDTYFSYIDYIVEKASAYSLYLAMVPMWAQTMELYDTAMLQAMGTILGKRYAKYRHIIWICGGEAAGEVHPVLVNALAKGLLAGHEGKHLMTVHPTGNASSSLGKYSTGKKEKGLYYFHPEPWLSFNMVQSGHVRDKANFEIIVKDYYLQPPKPVLEAEAFYEGHPQWEERDSENPYRANDYDVRKSLYWAMFSGSMGYTYGHHAVWQFYDGGDEYYNGKPTCQWKEALHAPGAQQLKYFIKLTASRPFFSMFPDNALLLHSSDTVGIKSQRVRVIRDGTRYFKDASCIMVYIPYPQTITINTAVIGADKLHIWYFNPRTGESEQIAVARHNTNTLRIDAITDNGDRVVVIDNVRNKYVAPGWIKK